MSFQDELRKNMRSPEEANRENIAKYSTQNGVKTVSCLCRISQRFLCRRSVNNSEQLRQNQQQFFLFRDPGIVYCTWECFEIEPKYSNEYHQYVEALKQLAAKENIQVEIVIHDATDNKKYSFPIKLKRFYSVHCYLSVKATTIFS